MGQAFRSGSLDGRHTCRLGLRGLNGRDWAYILDLSECWMLGDGRLRVARVYGCDPKPTHAPHFQMVAELHKADRILSDINQLG